MMQNWTKLMVVGNEVHWGGSTLTIYADKLKSDILTKIEAASCIWDQLKYQQSNSNKSGNYSTVKAC